ncbi:tyrosine-type recombinase/integrase [Parasporobacterium paucivorans]|uniref:Site-specific recombinase XerD n=1 Tax=Parasporobacterium paucivorans DSM 15970 TaxID=1122934 RepID=A0A1M6A454_9FIRM|nr:tyrosine-type recombinase/integrase [Parasporobacterium paucivorans]SHI31258.1 Site-specific recombinase XerD [Parasporobacterium paucivorans DSM 15970]
MPHRTYYDQLKIDNDVKIRNILSELPPFCVRYIMGIEQNTSSRTRLAYVYDLRVFFHYLNENHKEFLDIPISEQTVSLLDKITPSDIQLFIEFCKYYSSASDKERVNGERGIMRKLSAVKSMYNYFYRMEIITNNPAAIVMMPKLRSKEIVRLDSEEVTELLDEVESGDHLTKAQKSFHSKTKVRDLAILTLLLGTGIRVSECVGIDLMDVDFKNHGIRIRRKGGNEVVIYFGDEVESALKEYHEERMLIIASAGNEDAFFLSLQKKRIGVRSVELLVKKYAKLVTQLKNITPHKLRSTYGTTLYKETGDIYLVADVLGHKDVNTTKKHYAAIDEERRKYARDKVILRNTKQHPDADTASDSGS